MIDAALVGLGWWGKNHLAAVKGNGAKLRFVHGVSKEIDAALPLAEAHGFTLSDDLERALADPRVQAVVLATPHSLHTDQIVRVAIEHGIDAIIVANTTTSRPALNSVSANEPGGLSGAPLKMLALNALRSFRAASGGKIPLIGVGGIANADDAWQRIRAGASLIQLYSAMVYEGPGIARRIAYGLADRLRREGMANIAEAVGSA